MYSKFSLLFLLGFIGTQLCATTAEKSPALKEYVNTIKKEFKFSTSTPEITLSNRYGDIDITTASGNVATLEVTMTVESSSESRAEKIFDAIDIEVSDDSNSLDVNTELDNNGGWNFTKRSESYKIHYKVSIPKASILSVKNKYGDISITDLDNDLDVELKYGNARIGAVNGDVEFELGYCKQFIVGDIAGDVEMDISYSNFDMEDAQNVEIESKYSDINMGAIVDIEIVSKYDEYRIRKVRNLQNEGKYDKIKVGEVDEFNTESKYSHFSIDKLYKKGYFDTGYGSVDIREITSQLERITINAKHTNYDLTVNGGYQLDVDTEYVSVDYPSGLDISHREKDSNELILKGTKKGQGKGIIEATMKYGKLRIR